MTFYSTATLTTATSEITATMVAMDWHRLTMDVMMMAVHIVVMVEVMM